VLRVARGKLVVVIVGAGAVAGAPEPDPSLPLLSQAASMRMNSGMIRPVFRYRMALSDSLWMPGCLVTCSFIKLFGYASLI